MASKRDLKKDIQYLTSEVVSECFLFLYFHDKKQHGKITEIIEDTLRFQKAMLAKVNLPVTKNERKEIRKHYKLIWEQLYEGIDQQMTKLEEINKTLETKVA